jgi:phage shock protein A
MFARVGRIIRSFVGWFIELGEDPELILKQNIRDMEDQIPDMNKSIAMVRANQTLLEKETNRLSYQEKDITAKIKASLSAGRRDLALNFAATLEGVKRELKQSEAQLEVAKKSYEKMLKVKQSFLREKEKKSKQAMAAIQAKKRAEWQSKVSDAMESFTVAGIDATHDDMVRRLEETAAHGEAKLEMALDSIDDEQYQIEEQADKIQGNEILKQFELEMGISSPAMSAIPEAPAGEKTIGIEEKEKV